MSPSPPLYFGRQAINLDQIVRLEADRNYTNVVFENGSMLLLSKNIGYLHELLPSDLFLRISKKHVINVSALRTIKIHGYQRFVRLWTGQEFEISRRKATELRRIERTIATLEAPKYANQFNP